MAPKQNSQKKAGRKSNAQKICPPIAFKCNTFGGGGVREFGAPPVGRPVARDSATAEKRKSTDDLQPLHDQPAQETKKPKTVRSLVDKVEQ